MGSGQAITVVGSINMDLVATTPHLPAPGETVLGTAFRTAPGGKGSNQAIAAARAGGDVTFVGAVGTDDFGRQLTATLREAGVVTELLRYREGSSGIAVISVDAAAENNIIVIPGANADVDHLTDDDTAAITRSAMVIMQLEIPLPTVVEVAVLAHGSGVPVLLNPSPVCELPAMLVDNVDILVVNEGEAAELGAHLVQSVPRVVTTLGAHGARFRGPNGRTIEVAAPEVDAIDTTGAGDAFTGALAVALSEGLAPEQALQRACAAGALATTVAGAAASSPTREAIDAKVADTYGG